MSNIKRIRLILATLFITVLLILIINIHYTYHKQYRIIISSFLDYESAIIKVTAKMSEIWFNKRITEKGATIEEIEQEIFTNFIDPIHILKNGDAWIYNKDYVIFDKSSDFPGIYKNKSIREIFNIQKKFGAYHYDILVEAIEKGTDGKGWYVWLPEKGKEWAVWKSFRFNDQTWTIGLSTPEKEILDYTDIHLSLFKQTTYALVIILILTIVSFYIIYFQKKQDKLLNEINHANKTLTNINSMKNEFIANISHDFRTPLTIIFNLAELNLTERPELSAEAKEDLNLIYKTSYKFLSKINTLMDITKLETSGLKMNISKINLHDFISRTAAYHKSALSHSDINLSVKLQENTSSYFYTDIEKLEDIINNLMSNAVKFTNQKNSSIVIELKESLSKAEIIITDNGIGIDKEDLNLIFNRFEQGGKSYAMKYQGSGIGLSYSRQLAELLGGTIKAESSGINKGSSFTVIIDKRKFKAEDASPKEEIKKRLPKNIIFDIDSHKQKVEKTIITETNRQNEFDPHKGIILIAEDDYAIREIIVRYLKAEGYKNFIIAYDGEIALKLLFAYQPDLVITDYKMPNMNGDEFYSKVHSHPDFAFIPFIFISAIADEKIILKQKAQGAVDFLLKPIKRKELLSSVNMNMKKYMNFIKVSAIDELTGLLNRRVFFKYFENMILNPAITDLSLIMLDLDYFKIINDTYGHQAGDHILSKVCSTIISIIRSQDLAGRYGGEEFSIILPETNIKQAEIVAEKIRKAVEELDLEYQGTKLRITLSAGISSLAQSKEKTENREDKINNIISIITETADTALYYAKSVKCSSCSFFSRKETFVKENKCPDCGALIIPSRNRVEIYSSDLTSLSKNRKFRK